MIVQGIGIHFGAASQTKIDIILILLPHPVLCICTITTYGGAAQVAGGRHMYLGTLPTYPGGRASVPGLYADG